MKSYKNTRKCSIAKNLGFQNKLLTKSLKEFISKASAPNAFKAMRFFLTQKTLFSTKWQCRKKMPIWSLAT